MDRNVPKAGHLRKFPRTSFIVLTLLKAKIGLNTRAAGDWEERPFKSPMNRPPIWKGHERDSAGAQAIVDLSHHQIVVVNILKKAGCSHEIETSREPSNMR
jgi:hypothetical protein